MPRKTTVAARVGHKQLENEFRRAYMKNLANEHRKILDGEYVPKVEKKVSTVFWLLALNDGWNEEIW